MNDLPGHNYVDSNSFPSEPLPGRPARSALESTYARWCCGSILGVIVWILLILLLTMVPIAVVVLKKMVCSFRTFVRPR